MAYRKRSRSRSAMGPKVQFVKHFESMQDMLEYLDTVPANPNNRYTHASTHSRYEWDFGLGHAGAYKMLKTGWKEGAEQIADLSRPVFERIATRMMKPEPYFDVEGVSVDMGRLMEGEPECVLNMRDSETVDENRAGGIVHIVVNICVSAAFTAREFYQKGAAVAVLVDCLEYAGKRVILDVAYAHHVSNANVECMVRIKDAQDTLNPEMVAFTIAHPGFGRHVMFDYQARCPVNPDYGPPTEVETKGDIYIGSSSYLITRDPQAWAISQLKAQGIHFTEE